MTLDCRRHRRVIGVAALLIASGACGPSWAQAPLSQACTAALRSAGVVAQAAAGPAEPSQCSIEEPVTVDAVATRMGRVALPARPDLECRFAAVLGNWVGEVVSPVAAALTGSPLEALATGPGHQCRSRDGAQTKLSEHASGNAIDISALLFRDGRTLTLARLPEAGGAERVVLNAISTSACGYFTTVLGPGSDPAHSDHLHVDLAQRTIPQYRICMPR